MALNIKADVNAVVIAAHKNQNVINKKERLGMMNCPNLSLILEIFLRLIKSALCRRCLTPQDVLYR